MPLFMPPDAPMDALPRGPQMPQPPRMAGLSPEAQAQILALSGHKDEQGLLAQQMAQAQALLNAPSRRYSTGAASGIGGLATGLNAGAGLIQQKRAEGDQRRLGAERRQALGAFHQEASSATTPEARRKLATLGLLSGDESLGQYAKTEIESQAKADDRAFTGGENQKDRDARWAQFRAEMGIKEKEAAQKADGDKKKMGQDISDRFLRLPQTQRMVIAREAISQIDGASRDGAGDLVLIYGLANAIDPGAVVRAEDTKLVAGTSGLPGQAQSYFQFLTGKGTLTDEMRANIRKEAKTLWASKEKAFGPTRDFFRKQAEEAGLNADDVLIPTSATFAASEAAALPPDKQKRLEELRAKKAAGGIP